MMRHDMAMQPSFLERFRQEAQLIAPMTHRNIVHVYDVEELYRTVFIVMEYLEGQALEALLTRAGRLDVARAVDILLQVCAGLGYAHERGVIHRDVKPGNVFLLPQGHVKLLDFGLACPPGTVDLSHPGTALYAPPEQIRGTPVDERSDIYCVGIMAYEMVTGRRPYPEDDLASLMNLRCNADIPDPAELAPHVPDALRGFILTACERDPARRWQSVGQAMEALRPLERELGLERKSARRRMSSLHLFYEEDDHLAVSRLLDEFSRRARELGVDVKTSDFDDV
jgi:serine/threonine protein kinase